MRIWSIHPKYLDTKGLTAVWRETLLAKHVLEGKTKGYQYHPQLNRFKALPEPLKAIHYYLKIVFEEAVIRGYHYDPSKFDNIESIDQIPVTIGQIEYEKTHLLNKLEKRDPERFKNMSHLSDFEPHPLFFIIEGDIEPWEIIQPK
jgi:hypothetical protein